jgi:hypothetical protein
MSVAPPMPLCALCEQPLEQPSGQCPHCGAAQDWQELAEACDFAKRRFEDWRRAGWLSDERLARLTAHYDEGKRRLSEAVRAGTPPWPGGGLPPRSQCWSCRSHAEGEPARCPECGVIMQSPGVRSLRYWKFLAREIHAHQEAGRITLAQAHDLEAEVKERMAALRTRLDCGFTTRRG